MTALLAVQDLNVNYNSHQALKDVSFQVQPGAYIGVVGPNGSGKTTLLRTILGMVRPVSGAMSLFSQPVPDFDQWHRVGYLSQKASGFNPFFPATVREIIALGYIPGQQNTDNEKQATQRVLDLLVISDLQHKLIGELSGGQQQRVFLARALINRPELLILDEPSTALDPSARESFFALLNKLNKEQGMTIILVTHDIGTIGEHASTLLYLDKGVVFYGAFADFCGSGEMTQYFGSFAQHLICHQHRTPPLSPRPQVGAESGEG
jgi:zinc transport system ATP-binding protein